MKVPYSGYIACTARCRELFTYKKGSIIMKNFSYNTLNSINNKTIRLFKGVDMDVQGDKISRSVAEVQNMARYAMNYGIMFDTEILKSISVKVLNNIVNTAEKYYGISNGMVNSTFFQTLDQNINTPTYMRMYMQALNYLQTYGGVNVTSHETVQFGSNRQLDDSVKLDLQQNFTMISAFTTEELEQKVQSLLYSGMALDSKDVEDLIYLISKLNLKIEISKVKNREAMMKLSKELDLYPASPDMFMNYIYSLVTGDTMLVKNELAYLRFNARLDSTKDFVYSLMHEYDSNPSTPSLRSLVNRYHRMFLILRKNAPSRAERRFYNRIMRQGKNTKKNYRQKGILDQLPEYIKGEVSFTDKQILDALFNASTYKLARIYTYLVNLDKKDKNGSLYRIRNGKSYYVSGKEDLDDIFSSFISFKNVADNKVIKDLVSKIVDELFRRGQNAFADNDNKTVYYIPGGLYYSIPTSGKQFTGNIPDYTSFDFQLTSDERLGVGIHWDKQADLDLHAVTLDGNTFGWNTDWLDNDSKVVYSGDMTHLDDSGNASEIMSLSKDLDKPILLSVSPYYINASYRDFNFDLFVTRFNQGKLSRKLGAETGEVYVKAISKDAFNINKLSFKNHSTMTIGVIIPRGDGKFSFVLTNFNFGKVHVPDRDQNKQLLSYLSDYTENVPLLNNILGGKLVDDKDLLPHYTEQGYKVVDLSPANVTVDTFTDLINKLDENK